MNTTFSVSSDFSRLVRVAVVSVVSVFAGFSHKLKFQSAFTGGIGQSLDFAMVVEAAAVEDDLADVLALAALGDQFADLARRYPCWRALILSPLKVFLGGVRRSEGLALLVVDDLGVNVLAREMDGEARTLRSCPRRVLRRRAWRIRCFVCDSIVAIMITGRFCLPCGRSVRRRSGRPCPCKAPAGNRRGYRPPTWPTTCLSMPSTLILVFSVTVILIPSGIGKRIGCEKPRLRLSILPWTAALKPTP